MQQDGPLVALCDRGDGLPRRPPPGRDRLRDRKARVMEKGFGSFKETGAVPGDKVRGYGARWEKVA